MLNQVPAEAVYSATYVENYLDCVENFPNDLQRLISRMRELDVNYIARVREAQCQKELWMKLGPENTTRRGKTFFRMQQALSAAQELGDEKMTVLQTILEKIEMKTRMLDQDQKNLDYGKDDAAVAETVKEATTPVTKASVNVSSTSISATSAERPNKRVRRGRHDTFTAVQSDNGNQSAVDNNGPAPDHALRSQASNSNSTSNTAMDTTVMPSATVNTSSSNSTSAAQKKAAAATGKKTKKRKSRTAKEETPPREEESAIDPNEPTYCLCDQISFGEMIMCDNDLCPIEWFHFSCVSLSTKPKGKWFCPKCRGDRPNVMKPKAQFLKELERFNKEKEKEEKT